MVILHTTMCNWQALVLVLIAAQGKAQPTLLDQEDIKIALNATDQLITELDVLRNNEFEFYKYFAVNGGYLFDAIELNMRVLGVAESEVLRIDELVDAAMSEILIITQKQVTNKDDLTFMSIRVMASLINNLTLLPEDKANLEELLEQANNDLNSAWRVIYALFENVTQIIMDLIDGFVGESAEVIINSLEIIRSGLEDQYTIILESKLETANVSDSLITALEKVIMNNQA